MTEDSEMQDGILLSQDEMDKILCSVKAESKKQSTPEEVSLDLSQAELDALFAAPRDPAMQTPPKVERPKSISVVAGRAKWTKDEIQKFLDGTDMVIDGIESNLVEVLADGHRIAKGILIESDGKRMVKFSSACE